GGGRFIPTHNLVRTVAWLGVRGKRQPALCCAFVGTSGVAIAGMADGHVYVFADGGPQLRRAVKAHTGPVLSIATLPALSAAAAGADGGCCIVSGGVDGILTIFGADVGLLREFAVFDPDAATAPADGGGGGGGVKPARGRKAPPAIRGVSLAGNGGRALVATAAGNVLELSTADGSLFGGVWGSSSNSGDGGGGGGGVIDCANGSGGGRAGVVCAGHGGGGAVWGIACHPLAAVYATCGDDGVVRVWDPEAARPLHSIKLDTVARALAYSPDGAVLAVGCGGGRPGANAGSAGTLLVFDVAGGGGGRNGRGGRRDGGGGGSSGGGNGSCGSWAVLHESRPASEWLTDVRFSPDGARLAAASRDGRIYVHSAVAGDGYALVTTISAHRSWVVALDFSADSRCLQSADGAAVLAFSDAATGVVIPSAEAVRDLGWASHTLPLGWPLSGLRRGSGGGSGSGNNGGSDGGDGGEGGMLSAARSADEQLVAVGDANGGVRLARFPAAVDAPAALTFRGHARGVRRLAWLRNDDRLVTVGDDGAVLQWRRVRESDAIDDAAAAVGDDAADNTRELEPALHWPVGLNPRRRLKVATASPLDGAEGKGSGGGGSGGGGGGGSGGGSGPWLWTYSMVPPSRPLHADAAPPPMALRLEAVHGCRTWDVRGGVAYNGEEALVVAAAALGVVIDPKTCEQVFHYGHLRDVTALAVTPSGRFAATGDAAAVVRVWMANTGTCLRVLALGACAATTAPQGGEDVAVASSAGKAAGASNRSNGGGCGGDDDGAYVQCMVFSPDCRWLAVASASNGGACNRNGSAWVTVFHSASGSWYDAEAAAAVPVGSPRPHFLLFTGEASFPLMCGCGKRPILLAIPPSGGGGGGTDGGNGGEMAGGGIGPLLRKQVVFGSGRQVQEQLCGARGGGSMVAVTGSVSGHLHRWRRHELVAVVPGHAGAVYAIAAVGAAALATTGRDGMIRLWDLDLNKLRQFSPFVPPAPSGGVHGSGGDDGGGAATATAIAGGIRPLHSICVNSAATKFMVSTGGGELFELARDSGRAALMATGHGAAPVADPGAVRSAAAARSADGDNGDGIDTAGGGSGGGLWGLDAHPTDADVYATAGDDGFLRLWSVRRGRQLGSTRLDGPARAVAFAPDGRTLAVGMGAAGVACAREGAVAVADAVSLEVVHEFRKAKGWVSDLRYSADGCLLAVAAADGRIYLHAVGDGYRLIATTERPEPNDPAAYLFAADPADATATATAAADGNDGSCGAAAAIAAAAAAEAAASNDGAPRGYGALSGVDFSENMRFVRAVGARHRLLWFHVEDGRLASRTQTKDILWQSGRCTAGWDVQGVWPAGAGAGAPPVAADMSSAPSAMPAYHRRNGGGGSSGGGNS
ncbi:unnamed protein product, partial [Phaeothamnion confervicola]